MAILGSFGESFVASRRKRGPVAFRPRLSAGLALSLLTLKRSTDVRFVQSVNLIWTFQGTEKVRFGSLAAPFVNISLTSAFERIAAIRRLVFRSFRLNVRFSRKRTFDHPRKR